MVNFTAEQLRTQLKDVIKPVNNSSNDLNLLLETALSDDTTAIVSPEVKSSGVSSGVHGLWRGPLDKVVFDVSLDSNTFQKYKERRFGFTPDGLPEPMEDWTLIETYLNNFHYIEKGNTIFIVLDG